MSPAEVDDDDQPRSLRAFELADHDRAGARRRGPVHEPDRVPVDVLAHATGHLVTARARSGPSLGLAIGPAPGVVANGDGPGGDLDRSLELHPDPPAPTDEPERAGTPDLDARAEEHAPLGRDEGGLARTRGVRMGPVAGAAAVEGDPHAQPAGAPVEVDADRQDASDHRVLRGAHPGPNGGERDAGPDRGDEQHADEPAQDDDVPAGTGRPGDDIERRRDDREDDAGLG